MAILQKVKLKNFKRFSFLEVEFDSDMNIFIGDNESGKSTILQALELTLGGSRARIDSIGLENLFCRQSISSFLDSTKRIEDLPKLLVEIYLEEQNDPDLNGRNNIDQRNCDGLTLVCEPNDDLSEELREILQQDEPSFPFEYYDVKFFTFSGKPYGSYNRPIMHLLVDNAGMSNDYATRAYIKDLYSSSVVGTERNKHENEYRRLKESFKNNVLSGLNERLDEYSFTPRTTGKSTLEADLTIEVAGITIENKGAGQQCFIKTEFALNKAEGQRGVDIVLLEEPENHLSHVNMRRLIASIRNRPDKQLFITTHSNLVTARLGLKKCVLLNNNSETTTSLDSLSDDTAAFFMKAPDNNILEFILSKKVVLVEGDAEFILMESFFNRQFSELPEDSGVHIISVGGTSFKRYLELARLLNIKTAVIRDNDRDFKVNCEDAYADYMYDNMRVFAERDNSKSTFEICLYEVNKEICDELFQEGRRTLSVQDYMLKNKTEAAFRLLQEKADELRVPGYIVDAMTWIRD